MDFCLVLENAEWTLDSVKNDLKRANTEDLKVLLNTLYQELGRIKEGKKKINDDDLRDEFESIEEEYNKLTQEILENMSSGPPEIKPTDLIFNRDVKGPHYIGSGSFGTVYKCSLNGTPVAVKIPKSKTFDVSAFISEVRIMRKVFHPNIVMLLGASVTDDEVIMVSELMERDLEKYLSSPVYPKIPIYKRVKLGKDVAVGLSWLHELGILHRDLKLGNILMDRYGRAKIADFGFSIIKKKTNEFFQDEVKPKGNVLYMAPEVMQLQSFNHKADVYSYGIILYELLTGVLCTPPKEYSTALLYKKFVCELNGRPPILKSIPEPLKDLVEKCWAPNPADRPDIKFVVSALNDYLVNSSIEDPVSREFWRTHFVNSVSAELHEDVQVKYFFSLITKSLGLPVEESLLLSLNALFTWNWQEEEPWSMPSKTISIDKFNSITKMFGPIFLPEKRIWLSEVSTWVKEKWFHGTIELDKASKRIKAREKGTYLVRLSHSVKGFPFTITYINDAGKECNSRLAFKSNGDKFVYGTSSRTLPEALSLSGLELKIPCEKEDAQCLY
eukprot:TRINITY_DN2831_c0_g7_i1.p1 TRINITY_DN2831_c0_g7~~TRINITY_DN2831_c0_g7_i1.p1  ORF type:complete len:557 (+),score=98.77 TRINITY_DN2831_c0_g7_i1:53-1723(+)